MKYARVFNFFVLILGISVWGAAAADPLLAQDEPRCEIRLPNEKDSIRFAVAGDAGTGGSKQRDVARQMTLCHAVFPFEFVLMPGDNLYGSEKPKDYRTKFEEPFADLLKAEVKFYAALGNHDNPEQRFYKNFNMEGERYYSFEKGPVQFVALDSTYMSPEQLEWAEKELRGSNKKWKIVFFHHPIYSSGGRHGSDLELRKVLEPLFVQYGVDVVIAGHEHFYERIRPQKEITYFTSGAAGKLRKGNVEKTDLTAASFDTDRSFMLIEVTGDTLHFQSVSRTGQTVDSGTVTAREAERPKAADAKPTGSNREKRGENP
ncbi:MAG: metallophosphoesterase [Acidobacteria bacterium]|nr:MAG: metallophosphoesterase [Acidobacteriota bacterium]